MPAESAIIGPIDRIYAYRLQMIYASGRSITFMVEMTEMANILYIKQHQIV